MTPPPRPGKLIVLNGLPAAGKLTLGRALAAESGAILLDNHLLIDPVVAVIPERGAAHYALRRAVAAPIFDALRERLLAGSSALLTACLSDDDVGSGIMADYVAIAGADIPLLWVNAVAPPDVLRARVASEERRRGDKSKLTDVAVLETMLHVTLARPPETHNVRAVELDASGSLEDSVRRLTKIAGLSTLTL
ncbi:uncharacterized protein LOC62_02G002905 [Vanrija pseudolonga]|uniref:Uncharacterized protein n=1 Tax=Vanrija pseudolonga TaxID=143232 RepID=A0AAF0Y7Y1_9TREE|nr:hypothetical protein LOC62_02G002905 [Vanrija pseudolonga]